MTAGLWLLLLGSPKYGFKTTKLWYQSKKVCVKRGKFYTDTDGMGWNNRVKLRDRLGVDSLDAYFCVKSTPTQ